MGGNQNTWVWDRYWQFNRIASCFDRDGSNYPEDFTREWSVFFKALPDKAKILDLCTGNGAVARMAAEISVFKEKDFAITGVDTARIDPKKFAGDSPGIEAVTFLGEVSAEALPFQDDSFAAAVSQYGFEYTDTEKTVKEISRVLEPTAKVKLICHTEDALQTLNAKREIDQAEFILEELALHDAAKAATKATWYAEKGRPSGTDPETALQTFREKMDLAEEKLQTEPSGPFLHSTIALLGHTFSVRKHFPLETLVEKIGDAKTEALAHKGRLEALVTSALADPDAEHLEQCLTGEGFSLVSSEALILEDRNQSAGRVFEFERLA